MDKAISASGLKSIKKCKLQYYFNYRTELEGTKLSEGYLELGTAVHDAIESVLRERESLDLSDTERLSEILLTRYSPVEEGVPESMQSKGEDCLEKAAKFISDRADMGIRDIEEFHYFDLDDTDEAVAVMDVATDSEIIDWKTGKVRANDEKIQGGVYALAYEEKYGHPPDNVVFVYLKEGKVRNLDPAEQDWSDMWNYVGELRRADTLDQWPADPPNPCHFCSFEGHCSESPVGYGNIEWSQY